MKKFHDSFEGFLLSPIHPALFSVYFVSRMYVYNAHDIPLLDLIRPLLVSLALGPALYLLFLFLVRGRHAAAFMASALLFAFYLYGAAWSWAYSTKIISRAIPFASIWALSTLLLIGWVGWKRNATPDPNIIAGVNLMAMILLLFPVLQVIRYYTAASLPFPPKIRHVVDGGPPRSSPDIYYIILDSYPRADVLMEEYGFDNSGFLQSLRDLGFYVAECSQSNYASTGPSLTSTLNMDYIQNLSDTFQPGEVELMGLFKLLDENAVQESISGFGYETVSFASGFLWAEWRDADIFTAPPYGPMTEFETVVLFSSYARVLDDLGIVNLDDIHAERFRVRTRLVLGSFEELANAPGPKFVFIHLIVPHSPFAFDENGDPVAPDQADPTGGYLGQVKFINRFILPGLKTLVEESATPPVIILQGDHGPLLEDNHAAQMKILNAYRLPGGAQAPYPAISPVNTFRIVFNSYFGAKLPLLEDVSYYSHLSKRYDFTVMPNTCPK